MKELPNYFFRLHKKNEIPKKINNNYNNDIINMNYAENHYFRGFIEIDGAFAYYDSSPIIIIDENEKLFKVSKTINVSAWGKQIDLDDNNKFIINQNTVILIEDKLSFPKVLKEFNRNKSMKKDELYSSLNFIIFKTIKKINILEEYLTSISEGKKTNYSYYLVLVYNNNPILKMENIIINILKNLNEQNLIKFSSFRFKVIYALPCISFNDSKKVEKLEEDIKNMKNKMENMEETIVKLQKLLDKHGIKDD